MIYGLILAGGKGSRLYPLSRINKPKQFLKIINDKSFLANTVDRVTPLIKKENLYIITNKCYKDKVIDELDWINKSNIFTEPSNKETATCIGLSAVKLLKKDADATIVVLPSDHYIEENDKFIKTLKEAIELANKKRAIVTLGIEPRSPETGYGYIEMGEEVQGNIKAYKVQRFTEKPNIEVARDFLSRGDYLWNSGIFVFRADIILREYQKYLPIIYKYLMEIYKSIGEENEEDVINEKYSLIDGISIDFGIMQKTRKAYVIKCDFIWDDIGSFSALSKFLKREGKNRVSKEVYLEECENCFIFGNEKLIIGLGIKDLIVVQAEDVLLIVDKTREQEIKHLINDIGKECKYNKYL